MRTFRKVVLPVLWVVIFAVIAASLAVLAFGGESKADDAGLTPTGKVPVSNTIVARSTIENTVNITGTIAVDPPVSEEATYDGVVNHQFVAVGARVKAGDPLFQIRSEGVGAPGDDEDVKDDSDPRPTYHNVVASKAGKVAGFAKDVGDSVVKGDVVATVARTTFRATGSIRPVELYRLLEMPKSATVTIDGGPAPFTCGDLRIDAATATGSGSSADEDQGFAPGDVIVGGDSGGDGGGGTTVSCKVPGGVKVFDGLEMTMSINAGRAEDVLVVPVTAVRGLVDSGTVWVIEDGKPTEREVELGVSDGTVIEVTKGLKEGETVLEYVPGSKPGDKDMPGAKGSVVRIGR